MADYPPPPLPPPPPAAWKTLVYQIAAGVAALALGALATYLGLPQQ